jgi:hypothetical protein
MAPGGDTSNYVTPPRGPPRPAVDFALERVDPVVRLRDRVLQSAGILKVGGRWTFLVDRNEPTVEFTVARLVGIRAVSLLESLAPLYGLPGAFARRSLQELLGRPDLTTAARLRWTRCARFMDLDPVSFPPDQVLKIWRLSRLVGRLERLAAARRAETFVKPTHSRSGTQWTPFGGADGARMRQEVRTPPQAHVLFDIGTVPLTKLTSTGFGDILGCASPMGTAEAPPAAELRAAPPPAALASLPLAFVPQAPVGAARAPLRGSVAGGGQQFEVGHQDWEDFFGGCSREMARLKITASVDRALASSSREEYNAWTLCGRSLERMSLRSETAELDLRQWVAAAQVADEPVPVREALHASGKSPTHTHTPHTSAASRPSVFHSRPAPPFLPFGRGASPALFPSEPSGGVRSGASSQGGAGTGTAGGAGFDRGGTPFSAYRH